MEKHVVDLAWEAGVMKARLDLLTKAGGDLLAVYDALTSVQREHLSDIGLGIGFHQLRRAVDRAALPIESPEVPDAAS